MTVSKNLVAPLKRLKLLLRQRLGFMRDIAGYDIAALKCARKLQDEHKVDEQVDVYPDVWSGLGLSKSPGVAQTEKRGNKRSSR